MLSDIARSCVVDAVVRLHAKKAESRPLRNGTGVQVFLGRGVHGGHPWVEDGGGVSTPPARAGYVFERRSEARRRQA